MIIYEVRLEVQTAILDNYMSWLNQHVKDMLCFKGFVKALVLKVPLVLENPYQQVLVHYYVDDLENLNNYLDHHAKAVRQEGMHKFPNQFQAYRTIWQVENEIA